MENLELYEGFRAVPQEAKREIKAGRLKGMTDINPMWRIKALTERFGPCGVGWKYTIVSQWLEPGADGVVSAFCNIVLQYKWNGEWSGPIPGTGGSAYVAKERSGLYTSDECYKQALTDAISVAAKALGIGADVYWDKDTTKYSATPEPTKPTDITAVCEKCGKVQKGMKDGSGIFHTGEELVKKWGGRCLACFRESKAHSQENAAYANALSHEDAGDRP